MKKFYSGNFGLVLLIMLVFTGLGELQAQDVTSCFFSVRDAKYLRLVCEPLNSEVCIDELEIFGPESPTNLALSSEGAIATASSLLKGHSIHKIEHLNDGLYGNSHSWVAGLKGSQWAQIELPTAKKISEVVFSRDREEIFNDRRMARLTLMTSLDGKNWTKINDMEVSGPGADLLEDLSVTRSFMLEEYASLKAYGRADKDPSLVSGVRRRLKPYFQDVRFDHVGEDIVPLVRITAKPQLDGIPDETFVSEASSGAALVAKTNNTKAGPLARYKISAGYTDENLYLMILTDRSERNNTIATISTNRMSGNITSRGKFFTFEYTQGTKKINQEIIIGCNKERTCFEIKLPLEILPGYQDGLQVALGLAGRHTRGKGHSVRFLPAAWSIRQKGDGALGMFQVTLRADSSGSDPVMIKANTPELENGLTLEPGRDKTLDIPATFGPLGPEYDLNIKELTPNGSQEYTLHLFRYDPLWRTISLMAEMIERMKKAGLDVEKEIQILAGFRQKYKQIYAGPHRNPADERETFFQARQAKRNLFLRAPELSQISRILFVKRQAFLPSHNYSVLLDGRFIGGGGIYVLNIPQTDIGIKPENATVTELFNSGEGMARTPMADFDLSKIYFSYRQSPNEFYHIMRMNPDGTDLEQITDGVFHDYWPCPLPDEGIAFISTRIKSRFLCWRPQAFTLFRMDYDGSNVRALSFANLSEWAPSVMSDGRIIWTRSEYQDKGANFGHTLWAIQPDGTHPELVFGNGIIQPSGYANGREVPGTGEIACTMISHFGDLNGPIALCDTAQGRFNSDAIQNITPEMVSVGNPWPREECFRDCVPLSKDYFLVSHAPAQRFGLYLIDRYGNRELLYADPDIECVCPTPFRKVKRPPVLADNTDLSKDYGVFSVQNVYAGLEGYVKSGQIKYIRVCEEVASKLEQFSDGTFRSDHEPFMDWYATPVHVVSGPYGWPTYVAKASHGLVPVAPDGSATFTAPAGKVLYFQVLDEDYNELQRMRSVVQLQPGESRSCIGCHENRKITPSNKITGRLKSKVPHSPILAEWEGRPLDFINVVQPVLDRNCIKCHNADHPRKLDFRGDYDQHKVPTSYRTLLTQGLVHYADMGYESGSTLVLPPLSLGSLKSKVIKVIENDHKSVKLSRDELLRFKTWIDLNCPLWGDYILREKRKCPPNTLVVAN